MSNWDKDLVNLATKEETENSESKTEDTSKFFRILAIVILSIGSIASFYYLHYESATEALPRNQETSTLAKEKLAEVPAELTVLADPDVSQSGLKADSGFSSRISAIKVFFQSLVKGFVKPPVDSASVTEPLSAIKEPVDDQKVTHEKLNSAKDAGAKTHHADKQLPVSQLDFYEQLTQPDNHNHLFAAFEVMSFSQVEALFKHGSSKYSYFFEIAEVNTMPKARELQARLLLEGWKTDIRIKEQKNTRQYKLVLGPFYQSGEMISVHNRLLARRMHYIIYALRLG